MSEDNGAAVEVVAEQTPAETVGQVIAAKEGEAAPKDTPKVDPVKEEPKPDKMAAKFAALSKKDKEARAREKALEAREKAFADREAAAAKPKDEPATEKEPLKVRMKRDPFTTMKEEFGLDLDVLTKIALNQGKLTPDMELRLKQDELDSKYETKLEALERRLAEKDEAEKSAAQKSKEETAMREFKSEIKGLISSDKAAYELLGLEDDADQIVFDVINQHYQATYDENNKAGKIMTIKEAADHVENHLLDVAKKYTGLSKVKGLFEPPKTVENKNPAQGDKAASKTLSNDQSAAPSAPTKRVQTREEELAEAMKLIKFTSN